MLPLEDGFSRRFYYLRLSVTDVCNFRCTYCLPDGYHPPQGKVRNAFLSIDEIRRVVTGFAAMGTRKVRLTGGEPSLRRDFTAIIDTVANIPEIEKVAMTTNGYRLKERAREWFNAGLNAINVSVDSLDPRQFHQITGENKLAEIMEGIDAALGAGFTSIKINAVLLKGLNDYQLEAFLAWIKDKPIELRFIELMQTGEMDTLFRDHHLSGEQIKQQLLTTGWIQQLRNVDDGPAQVFMHPASQGGVGLIMPYSKDFCAGCNRLRVSSLGKLHLCLFGDGGIDLRDLLVSDEQQDELQQRIRTSLQDKSAAHRLHDGNAGMTPHLASIGG
ncbi:GTP 3',8-cyclase MoaA [Aeromonas cavernicola]|uniref:GTP 3',8-cyclase n=1 Tax=Aeromonas cavernicola TaxID=1006623 RepID=A0A2H9U6Y0_9GAMM|nr:GTP 3',8-cyclase MoaA [Aeromonas cavernicola]PJG59751.1 GTP 3',8-cyclase MoaA [Aeromonas cavernicola]